MTDDGLYIGPIQHSESLARRDECWCRSCELRRFLASIDPAELVPTGEHKLVRGYCPDCSGSCLVGFGNPAP